MLKAAQKAVQRALLLEDIEVETKIEGQLLLAHVDLLSGHTQQAYERAVSVLEEARCCELVWLIARAQRILGSILARQDQQAQAQPCFEQALEAFRKSGMHIEYERTLHEYEAALCYDFHEQGDTHVE